MISVPFISPAFILSQFPLVFKLECVRIGWLLCLSLLVSLYLASQIDARCQLVCCPSQNQPSNYQTDWDQLNWSSRFSLLGLFGQFWTNKKTSQPTKTEPAGSVFWPSYYYEYIMMVNLSCPSQWKYDQITHQHEFRSRQNMYEESPKEWASHQCQLSLSSSSLSFP